MTIARRLLISFVSAFALLGGPSSALPAAPVPAGTQAAADFLLATCRDSAHNLAAVAQRAAEQHWTSMLKPNVLESDPVQVKGMWRVDENGQAYTVTTGTGPRNSTTCMVFFGDPKPRRDDIVAAVSNALTLKPTADTPGSEWRSEMYQVENLLPNNVILQVVSSNGDVFSAAIMGN
jgi:hypothetical protein